MKIKKALKKSIKNNVYINSESLRMSNQDPESLVHWLLIDGTDLQRVQTLGNILKADDWELGDKIE